MMRCAFPKKLLIRAAGRILGGKNEVIIISIKNGSEWRGVCMYADESMVWKKSCNPKVRDEISPFLFIVNFSQEEIEQLFNL